MTMPRFFALVREWRENPPAAFSLAAIVKGLSGAGGKTAAKENDAGMGAPVDPAKIKKARKVAKVVKKVSA